MRDTRNLRFIKSLRAYTDLLVICYYVGGDKWGRALQVGATVPCGLSMEFVCVSYHLMWILFNFGEERKKHDALELID